MVPRLHLLDRSLHRTELAAAMTEYLSIVVKV